MIKAKSLFFSLFSLLWTASSYAQNRIILFGGGAMPPEATQLASSWSPGGKLLIIAFPSREEAQNYINYIGNAFKSQARMPETHIFSVEDIQTDADRDHFIKLLNEADMVFMSGGDQIRGMATLEKWGVLDLFKKALKNKIYLGKSAGTAMSANLMITGSESPPLPGLGIFDAIVDTHFLARGRPKRLKELMQKTGKRYGIGVDEDGALAFDGQVASVIGQKDMMFYEQVSPGQFVEFRLKSGEKFDLKSWTRLDPKAILCNQLLLTGL